jgi:hypothetical protein
VLNQYVTEKFPTLERLALNRLRERFPPFRRPGLSKTIRKALPDIDAVRIIPDGWFVEGDLLAGEDGGECATITCIEIEDAHPLSAEKLWRYCELYDTLDFYCCGLRLFVFDRYGLNERELDLRALFVEGIIEIAGHEA